MDSAFCLIYGNKFSVSPTVVSDGYTLCIFGFKRSTPYYQSFLKVKVKIRYLLFIGLYGPNVNKSYSGEQIQPLSTVSCCWCMRMSTHWLLYCMKWITPVCYIYTCLSLEPSFTTETVENILVMVSEGGMAA